MCELLAGHTVHVALDGDVDGRDGQQRLIQELTAAGVSDVRAKDMPDGMYVADILIDRNATGGCGCATCTRWRADRPAA